MSRSSHQAFSLTFQSSPALKSGCYLYLLTANLNTCTCVSILTRPEERVLPGAKIVLEADDSLSIVSILTRPEERVLL